MSGSGDPALQPSVDGDRLIAIVQDPAPDTPKKRAREKPPRASQTCQDPAIPTYRLLQRYVGRGPVPRRVSDYRSPRGIAGACPPRTLYFACFTSPNVVNARCAGDTGPRNRRVINVSGLPPNETSSIW